MEQILAFCGIDCSECPAYRATQLGDRRLQNHVLRRWRQAYDVRELLFDDIACDSCQAVGGQINNFCGECPVRECGLERGVTNCAYCPEYPCDTLNHTLEVCSRQSGYFAFARTARNNLETVRVLLPV